MQRPLYVSFDLVFSEFIDFDFIKQLSFLDFAYFAYLYTRNKTQTFYISPMFFLSTLFKHISVPINRSGLTCSSIFKTLVSIYFVYRKYFFSIGSFFLSISFSLLFLSLSLLKARQTGHFCSVWLDTSLLVGRVESDSTYP